jgi:thiamine biosynthesis lipoprotein
MEYDEFRAMNCDIVLAMEGDARSTREGFRQVREFVHSGETRFTRFSDSSELAALNRSAGEWMVVSSDMYWLVHNARDYVEQTGGLFDPSILNALERAGYDQSMDKIRAAGGSGPRTFGKVHASDVRGVQFDADRHALRLPRGLRLDLGGIAKGWIAERAAQQLAAHSPACAVSAGGDMAMRGLPAGEVAWDVALEDPREPENSLVTLRVGPGAIATSSVTTRRWQQGARTMHHLIDPRTQQPAKTDWLSVTVVAPDIMTAEVFAKALLIAGSREAEKVAARRDDISFIAVDALGRLTHSSQRKDKSHVELQYN